MKQGKLFRSRTDRKIAGICGGLAEYTGLDANLIRIIFIVISFLPGPSVIFYLIAWVIIPTETRRI